MKQLESQKKADFIQEEYTALAKKINSDIEYLDYVHDYIVHEEYLIVFYKHGGKKILCITEDSLKAVVEDTIIKL